MPLPRIELHPAAIEEAHSARLWYATRSGVAGDAFMAEIDTAIEHICESPQRWAKYLHDTRRYLLRRFPYVVVYREVDDHVQVLAIAHGKRRPGYWRSRM